VDELNNEKKVLIVQLELKSYKNDYLKKESIPCFKGNQLSLYAVILMYIITENLYGLG
jgi:hypothetical protein